MASNYDPSLLNKNKPLIPSYEGTGDEGRIVNADDIVDACSKWKHVVIVSSTPNQETTREEYFTNLDNQKKQGQYRRWEGDRLMESGHYIDDRKHGRHYVWNKDGGFRTMADYNAGDLHGIFRQWFESAKPGDREKLIIEYKNGWNDGQYLEWWPNGQLKCNRNYNRGHLDSVSETWYDNGQSEINCNFQLGNFHGPYTKWRQDGNLLSQYIYSQGTMTHILSDRDGRGREYVLGPGQITVWKACRIPNTEINVYVELLVPAHAQRVTTRMTGQYNYKARVSEAKVVSITDKYGLKHQTATSFVYRGKTLSYTVGETVRADGFDNNPQHDCGHGINVHLNRDHCDQWF